jgi:hypothetical protein
LDINNTSQNKEKQTELYSRLLEKSIEAFIMGLEIYNKPTIKYRIEGFSFFVCNAWELMLKAKMISDGKNIHYRDKPYRTFDLSKVLQSVYTDKKQPLRINLEKIIDLRNISVHYVTTDYESIYAPLFQSSVINFTNEIDRFHGIDITQYISQDFLTISASMNALTSREIRLKYDAETAERLILQKNDIEVTTDTLESSEKFAIQIEHRLVLTKSKSNADLSVAIDRDAKNKANIIKEYKDPADTHKYSYTNLLEAISERIHKANINFEYHNKAGAKKTRFTTYTLELFLDFYDMKNRIEYAYPHIVGNARLYTYSQQALEFIMDEIRKDPQNIVNNLIKVKKR